MKKIAIIGSFLCVILAACKKDKNQAAPSNPVTTPSTTMYDGILSAMFSQNTQGDSLDNGSVIYTGSAWFGSTPYPGMSNTNFVKIDSVALNNTFFKFSAFYYLDSTYGITGFPAYQWHVKGNSGIPSFDYTNPHPMPSYTGFKLFPNSIDHTKNVTLLISGITNATYGYIYISDGVSNRVYREVNLTTTSVTFTASDLSVFTPGNALLYIDVYNDNVQSIAGKTFNFVNQYQLNKYITIN